MADYKDMLAGALGTIAGKVKEAAEGKSFQDIYEDAASRASNFGKVAKLTLDVNSEAEELKRVYVEIGKLCYEQNRYNPSEYFAPLFSRIDELEEKINEKKKAIDALKSGSSNGDIKETIEADIIEFGDIVDKTGNND